MPNWPENDEPNAVSKFVTGDWMAQHTKILSATKLRQANCKAQWLDTIQSRFSAFIRLLLLVFASDWLF